MGSTSDIPPTGKPIPRLPKETSIYIQGSTSDLYHRIAAEAKFSVHRLRLTKEDGTAIPNEKSVTVDSLGLAAGGVVQAKDLGIVHPSTSPLHHAPTHRTHHSTPTD